MIREIAGRQNHSVRLARKLQKKKYRKERRLLVCEGMDLLYAAAEAGAPLYEVLVRGDLLSQLPRSVVEQATQAQPGVTPVAIGVCDEATLEYAGSLGGGVDVVVICAEPAWHLRDLPLVEGLTFFLDGVGDPGNVGAIIRSALALGVKGVICAPGTADPYSPKAMRAGMGAQFVLPVVTEVSAADLRSKLETVGREHGLTPTVWVADPREGVDVAFADLAAGNVVVLGAERSGPGPEWPGAARLRIPQERFDSLNVAMAATIIAYEWQRRLQHRRVSGDSAVSGDGAASTDSAVASDGAVR